MPSLAGRSGGLPLPLPLPPDGAAPGDLRRIVLDVEGMRCAACAWWIERELGRLSGVVDVGVSFASDRAVVDYRPEAVGDAELRAAVEGLGYGARPAEAGAGAARIGEERRRLLPRLVVAAVFTLAMMDYQILLLLAEGGGVPEGVAILAARVSGALAAPVLVYAGWPVLLGAYRSVRRRAAGADLLVCLGALAAFGASAAGLFRGSHQVFFEASAAIVAFSLLGRYVELLAKERFLAGAEGLARLVPRKGRRVEAGGERWVASRDLRPGDLVAVEAGEALPADGQVVEGRSEVAEGAFTGEVLPVLRGPGDCVLAGTANSGGRLLVRVEAAGPETALLRLLGLAGEARVVAGRRPGLADRLAARFVPGVLGAALATWIGWALAGEATAGLWHAAGVLAVACPCAFGLAAPAALAAAAGRGLAWGIAVREGAALEGLARCRAVVLDKTGTLTAGRPVVRGVSAADGVVSDGVASDGVAVAELLARAAAVEEGVAHPVARALVEAARGQGLDAGVPGRQVSDRQVVAGLGAAALVAGDAVAVGSAAWMARRGLRLGRGLAAEAARQGALGRTVCFVGWDRRVRGVVALEDPLRPEAGRVVAALRARGCQVYLATGDNEGAARAAAAASGAFLLGAGLSPAAKAAAVASLESSGTPVAMVGDGVNDAPALARATCGLAFGGGPGEVAQAAGMSLASPDLFAVVRALDLARAASRTARQNLFWALVYNAAGIPLAALGPLSPVLAALAMGLSSLSVLLNALRLQRLALPDPSPANQGPAPVPALVPPPTPPPAAGRPMGGTAR